MSTFKTRARRFESRERWGDMHGIAGAMAENVIFKVAVNEEDHTVTIWRGAWRDGWAGNRATQRTYKATGASIARIEKMRCYGALGHAAHGTTGSRVVYVRRARWHNSAPAPAPHRGIFRDKQGNPYHEAILWGGIWRSVEDHAILYRDY